MEKESIKTPELIHNSIILLLWMQNREIAARSLVGAAGNIFGGGKR